MKSTWQKSDNTRRRYLSLGFLLFVIGVVVSAYCGYADRYLGEQQPPAVILMGWGLLIVGLVLFVFGLLLSPIQR